LLASFLAKPASLDISALRAGFVFELQFFVSIFGEDEAAFLKASFFATLLRDPGQMFFGNAPEGTAFAFEGRTRLEFVIEDFVGKVDLLLANATVILTLTTMNPIALDFCDVLFRCLRHKLSTVQSQDSQGLTRNEQQLGFRIHGTYSSNDALG